MAAIEILLRLFNSSATTGKRTLVLNMALMLVASLASLLSLAAVAPLVGAVISDGDTQNIDLGPLAYLFPSGFTDGWSISHYAVLFCILYAIATFTKFVALRFQYAYASYMQESIGTAIFREHVQQSLQEIRAKQRSSDVTREIMEDTTYIIKQSVFTALEFITSFLYVSCIAGFLLYLNWEVTLLLVVCVLGYYLLVFRTSSAFLERLGASRNIQNDIRHTVLSSMLRNTTEMKFSRLEDRLTSQFRRTTLAVKRADVRIFDFGEFPQTLLEISVFLVLSYFTVRAGGGSISPQEKADLLVTLGVFALSMRMLIPSSKIIYNAQVHMTFTRARFEGVMDSAEGKNKESITKIDTPVNKLTVQQVPEPQTVLSSQTSTLVMVRTLSLRT